MSTTFVLISLCLWGGFRAILGGELAQSPIQLDFSYMSMHFHYEGQPVFLQGAGKIPNNQILNAALVRFREEKERQLHSLLIEISVLFNEPSGLPLSRSFNHRMIVEQGTNPVVVRPYRYTHEQKDELEKQCTKMLAKGFIRPSTTSFSSPVILVFKSDHT